MINKNRFKPPIIALLLALIFGIIGFFYGKVLYFPYTLLGIIFIVGGIWIMNSAYNLFIKKKTGVSPLSETTKFIVSGVYKITRNPMYVGLLLTMIGVAVLIGSYISLIAPALFILIMNYTWIPFEEIKMEKQFNKEYLDYKKKVRRWI